MPPRRPNDAQVDRLLTALHSLEYRQQLARKIADQSHGKTKYASAMRRLQRYVTEAGERRSFIAAPTQIRQQVRRVARATPVPVSVPRPLPKARPLPPPAPRSPLFSEIPPAPVSGPRRHEPARQVTLYDLRALVAYHDGDAEETAQSLGLSRRHASLLELAKEGVDVFSAPGGGDLIEPARRFFTYDEDSQDVEDLSDLLNNLPDWQIGMILEDLEEGNSDFGEWLDRWREDGMIFRHRGDFDDDDLEDSAYWELWRAAYERVAG